MMKVVILGGKADGISCVEIAESMGGVEVVGFLNDFEPVGSHIAGYPILETIDNWHKIASDIFFVYALHQLKDMYARYYRLKNLKIPKERFTTLIHPQSVVSRFAKIGNGSVIYPFTTIANFVSIGDFCSVRAGASIGHDCDIGEFNYIGYSVTLSGYTKTGIATYIAPNAVVGVGVNGVSVNIANFATVGMGTALNKNVKEYDVVQGNPALIIGNYEDKYTS